VLAKTEQQEAELPQTMDRLFRLSSNAPETMVYFDQKQPETLPGILSHLAAEMRQGRSVLIHVEGNRALSCRYPVKDISSAVVDVALQANAPIVPVRFLHGLPVGPLPHKTEWPYQWGRQDYCFGTPIPVKVLKPMTLLERRLAVRDAINQTGLPNELETPSPGDPQFAASIALRMKQDGLTQTQAVLMELANMPYGSKAEQIFPIEHLRGDRE
jgi:1-acyl-sn-glycerol-3-phosphate acyltransferase